MWDKTKSIAYLDEHARNLSTGKCAEYVRKAVEAGGIKLIRQTAAKDYGNSLTASGFLPTPASNANLPGDIAIIQPIAGHPHGHMAMFNGKIWVSDFKQLHGVYPGPSYRNQKPPYTVYRKI